MGAACMDKPGIRCEGILGLCDNPTYSPALRENCKLTCKKCNEECKDTSTVCGTWEAMNGFCGSPLFTSDFKIQYCGQTCEFWGG
jgi:hypothetical protein